MTVEENKVAARRLYEEVFGRGNLAAADEIMDPACVSHGPGSPPNVGTEQIKRPAVVLRGAFPDLRAILHDQVAEGDRVASRWEGAGTFTGTFPLGVEPLSGDGKPITFAEIRIDRFEGGKIVESWFIPDRMSLWQRLGLVR